MQFRFVRNSLITATLLLAGATQVFGQFAATGATTLSVTVAAESAINVTSSATSLSEAAVGAFGSAFTGTTNFSYKVRSTKSGGGGSITVRITSDFSPAGGPSVAAPPTGDALTYTCTAAASATPCTGSVTASASGGTLVANFVTNAHSASAGDTGSVVWTLPNDPVYNTGSYTATATFTISAT